MDKTNFTKKYSNPTDIISILESRGLVITDKNKAENYLRSIGYFRLSAYCYPLLKEPKENHLYKDDSTFTKILNMYKFDRKLRILLFNEIEKIEVAIRSIIINTGCEYFNDCFWLTDQSRFYNQTHFTKFQTDLKNDLTKSSEDFINHFRQKYNDEFPPSWCIAETLSLGTLCYLYKNINGSKLKKDIALKFGLLPIVFESWILTIAGVRNICCHHGRLWNRTLKLKPTTPDKKNIKNSWIDDKADIQKIYYRICITKFFLQTISPNNNFKDKLISLLNDYPEIDINAMGFTADWQEQDLWK